MNNAHFEISAEKRRSNLGRRMLFESSAPKMQILLPKHSSVTMSKGR